MRPAILQQFIKYALVICIVALLHSTYLGSHFVLTGDCWYHSSPVIKLFPRMIKSLGASGPGLGNNNSVKCVNTRNTAWRGLEGE